MANSIMPSSNGSLGSGINAPIGSTVIKVHVPWNAGPTAPRPATGLGPAPTPSPTTSGAGAGTPQMLSLNVNGPSALTQTIALSPGSANCATASTGSVCQAALPLAAGTYTASVAAYSTPNAAPNGLIAPAQTIAFSVDPGAGSVLNLTLSAVPVQLAVVPASPMSDENSQSGIDLYGAGKHELAVEMLDANQNVIVGAASPNFSINQAGGQLSLAIAQPSSSAPNVFWVTASSASSAAGAMLKISATSGAPGNPCLQIGAACTGTVPLDVRQVLAVANSGANSVTLYAAGQNLPLATVQIGVNNPQALVFDAAGDLFVASQAGTVTEYAAPYTGLPTNIAIGVNHPQALALDARGNLFVANGSASNTVTEYAPPYGGGPVATISTGIDDPVSLALDSAGSLYVANQSSNAVTVYAVPYNDAPIALTGGLNGPNSIAIDSRGNLFVSNLNTTPNAVVEYSPPFSAGSVPAVTITNGISEQGAIAIAGSSNLFVPNQGSNSVTEYLGPYTGAPATITGGQNEPVALAVDAQGNLFVANYGNNTVTQYPPPYVGTSWTTYSNGVNTPQALALSPPTTSLP
jgi:hypothetical protein